MKLKLFSAIILLSTFAANHSEAAIYLEPYAGYQSGTLKGSFDYELENNLGDGDLELDNTTTATLAGLRFGLGLELGLSLGGDVQYSFDSDGTKVLSYGPFVGYELPIPLRFYGTYFVSSKANVVDDGDKFDMTGNGYRVGVGFTFLPLVSINVEYESLSFNTFEYTKGGSSIDTIDNVSIKNDSVNVVLSVPIMI